MICTLRMSSNLASAFVSSICRSDFVKLLLAKNITKICVIRRPLKAVERVKAAVKFESNTWTIIKEHPDINNIN